MGQAAAQGAVSEESAKTEFKPTECAASGHDQPELEEEDHEGDSGSSKLKALAQYDEDLGLHADRAQWGWSRAAKPARRRGGQGCCLGSTLRPAPDAEEPVDLEVKRQNHS